MRARPERTAWLVLISAFVSFCVLSTGTIFGGRWWLQNAARSQIVENGPSGTVLVTRPGRTAGEANISPVPIGSVITSQGNAQATLTFKSPDGEAVIAFITLYGDTEIELAQADSPRFPAVGLHPHHISVHLRRGRLRVVSGLVPDRDVQALIRTSTGALIAISGRSRIVSVETLLDETLATVREGQATISAAGQSILLEKDERATAQLDSPPAGPLPAERNLIQNGDFVQPLESHWVIAARQAIPDEPPGATAIITSDGRQAVNFYRSGPNWAEVGIRQEINRDVRDYTSLRLQADVYITYQDVRNCGNQGTECPIMFSLRYVDRNGSEREWIQGVYYRFDPDPIYGFTSCIACPAPNSPHERIDPSRWKTYDSGNLLQLFADQNAPAAIIKSLTVFAAGHSYDSRIAQIQLLAED